LDFTDPIHPQLAGQFNTGGDSAGIAVSGDLIYVADGSMGLRILGPARPILAFRRSTVSLSLSWPASATNFVLQSATTLANGGDWQDSSLQATVVGDQNVVTVDPTVPTAPTGFFRLRGQ
jgi:hypothetical protein